MIKVIIGVPVINLWESYTKKAIASLESAMMRAKVKDIDCRLLLVDNASTDNTQEEASKKESTIFTYIRNNQRKSFSQSVNQIIKYGQICEADYFFICNNDIIMHPEAIWRLVERMESSEGLLGKVGMATCMDVTGETTPEVIEQMNPETKAEVEEAEHPCFSAFMLSREAVEEVGEFDEVFFPAYHEDNDYHRRMQLIGIPAIVLPTALFYHYGSRTRKEAAEAGTEIISNEMFEYTRKAYIEKWGGYLGNERFEIPYGDENNSLKTTQQNLNALQS